MIIIYLSINLNVTEPVVNFESKKQEKLRGLILSVILQFAKKKKIHI